MCLEECSEKLGCKCNGFGHAACIREWMAARLKRGDSREEALKCELCRSYIAAADDVRVCSWRRCRILAVAAALLVFTVLGCAYSILLLSPSEHGTMTGIIVLACFLAVFSILRVLIDPGCICIRACLCYDLTLLD